MHRCSHRTLALFASLALLALGACVDDTVEFGSREADVKALSHRIDSIEGKLSELRGLAFTRPLHVAVITRDEYIAQIKNDLAGMPLAYDRFYSMEMAQLGFFPDSSASMKQLYIDYYGGFPAGYYVDGTDSIYVLGEYAHDKWFLDHGLPHELTHALQEQALHAFDRDIPFTGQPYYRDDHQRFRSCLYEGDAELTSTAFQKKYQEGFSDPFTEAAFEGQSRRSKDFARWDTLRPPRSFFAPATTPYGSGMAMVADAWTKAPQDMASVNAMYAWSDAASRTVFTGLPRGGTPIDFSGVFAQVDTSGGFTDDMSLGSMHLMSMFIPQLTQDVFNEGMGWTGDRFLFTRKLSAPLGTLVWAQIYETPQKAAWVFQRLLSLIPWRFQGTTYNSDMRTGNYPTGTYDATYTYTSDGLYTVIIQKGQEVWWVENAGAKTDAIIAALGNRSGPVVALAKGAAVTRGLPPFFSPPRHKRFVAGPR